LKTDSLNVKLAGLRLANPTMLASGILGYSAVTLENIVKSGAGAIVTKSIGLESREGYPNPIIVQSSCGLINAMGLPNPGMDEFTGEIRAIKSCLNVPLVVSVYGFSAIEYGRLARRSTDSGADAVELNVSCPHVEETGSEIGQDKQMLREAVAEAKLSAGRPIFVKLSPNVTCIADMAETAVEAGADVLTVANTVSSMAIDVETVMPILSNKVGGLSGPAIKPIALKCVYDVYERVDVPIVACGGVTNWRDAVEFFLVGASAVQIGTAIALNGLGVFKAVARGISAYLKRKDFGNVEQIVGLAHKS